MTASRSGFTPPPNSSRPTPWTQRSPSDRVVTPSDASGRTSTFRISPPEDQSRVARLTKVWFGLAPIFGLAAQAQGSGGYGHVESLRRWASSARLAATT